jgi:hypothetical protein
MILVAGPSLSTDQISWPAAGALDSGHLHLNLSLTFVLSFDFH